MRRKRTYFQHGVARSLQAGIEAEYAQSGGERRQRDRRRRGFFHDPKRNVPAPRNKADRLPLYGRTIDGAFIRLVLSTSRMDQHDQLRNGAESAFMSMDPQVLRRTP